MAAEDLQVNKNLVREDTEEVSVSLMNLTLFFH